MASARVTALAQTTIAGAVTGQLSGEVKGFPGAKVIAAQATFNYGSGGTTVKAWLQTSLDGGTTWHDIANFAFTTSAGKFLHNVVAEPATPYTPAAPTDATLADNTVKNGPIGDRFRVKYTTTGTYAGATNLRVDLVIKD